MNLTMILLSLLTAGIPIRQDASFPSGEHQVYIVHYQWGVLNADIARAYCSIDSTSLDGAPAYRARVYGRTAKFCESIVKVREDFRSWISAERLRPEKYSREALEGKFKGGEVYDYDWEAGKLHMNVNANGKIKEKEMELEAGVLDVPSLFYAFRMINLEKISRDKAITVKVAVGDNIETVVFRYAGDENLNVRGMERIPVHKFLIQVNSGKTFDTKNAISLYAKGESSLLPVYFEAPMRLGRVVGRLETSD